MAERIEHKANRKTTPLRLREVLIEHLRDPELPGTPEIFHHFLTSERDVLINTTYYGGKIYAPTTKNLRVYKVR